MSPDISEYPDAVDRIVGAEVPPDATTDRQVMDALRGAEAPQINRQVAQNLRDSVLTEDKILDAIDSSGELPTEGEIDSMSEIADQYDMSDRQQEVAEAVEQRVVTREQIDRALSDSDPSRTDEPVFREDIEEAVEDAIGRSEMRGASEEQVIDEAASELGAPSRQEFQAAQARTISESSDTSPAEVIDNPTEIDGIGAGTAEQAVPTIRDESGEIVAVSGANETVGQAIADEIGAEYRSLGELQESIDLEQSRGRAEVTIDSNTVREIPL